MSANSVVLVLLVVGVVALIGWSLFDWWRTLEEKVKRPAPMEIGPKSQVSFPQILTLLLLAASLFVILSKQYEANDAMGRGLRGGYEDALGRREVETGVADSFEAEFPVITARTVKILSAGESPDRVALIDGIETGVELTSIKAGSADHIIAEVLRLATQKHESYERRAIFDTRPIILLGHLDWPARDVEGPALYDVHEELAQLIVASDFDGFRFSEIWLMDDGPKYTSRRDPRTPADFFCFAPSEKIGFWERERKRRPYWGLIRDFLT